MYLARCAIPDSSQLPPDPHDSQEPHFIFASPLVSLYAVIPLNFLSLFGILPLIGGMPDYNRQILAQKEVIPFPGEDECIITSSELHVRECRPPSGGLFRWVCFFP